MRVSVESMVNAISKLPDLNTHKDDLYTTTVFEPYEPDPDNSSPTVRTITLVFKKNLHLKGWDLLFEESSCM